jgi:hypothetical protein
MTPKRFFYLQMAVFVLAIALIIGGTVGGNIVLQEKSRKLSDLKVENGSIELQQKALIQAKKDIERYSSLDTIAKSVVPQDKDQAKTVREIVSLAAANHIPIKSISFETSKLGEAPAKPTTPEGGDAAPKTTIPSVSQVKAVPGINGVFTLPIQVESAGQVNYTDFLSFLESLEKNRRTAHVGTINLNPTNNGKTLTFNLTLNAYVKP